MKNILESTLDSILGQKSKPAQKKPRRKPISRDLLFELAGRASKKGVVSCENCNKPLIGEITPKANIHHKDGNPVNNNINNLVVLCPNCHSIADMSIPKKKKAKKIAVKKTSKYSFSSPVGELTLF